MINFPRSLLLRPFICLGIFCLLPPVAAALPVHLGTQINDAALAAETSGLPLVECVFETLDQTLHIRAMPWRRAQQDVKRQLLDGFFMAIPDVEAEGYATLSAPLILENWYWFSLPHTAVSPLLHERRTGVILGSHQERWLWEKKITPTLVGRDLSQLIKLLFSGRIEGVIADKEVFDYTAKQLGLTRQDYKFEFLTYMPLAVYFGNHYLRATPTFLSTFNQHIPQCVKEPFELSPGEQEIVKERANFIRDWLRDDTLQQTLKEVNHLHTTLSQEEILERDLQWRRAVETGNTAALWTMVNENLSTQLQRWRAQHDFVNEIIVTDVRGLNVATSPWSSDYWQGDEEKFIAAIAADYGQRALGEVEYDRSTGKFQVSVSAPIYIPGHIYPQGALIVGVDIHRALQKSF